MPVHLPPSLAMSLVGSFTPPRKARLARLAGSFTPPPTSASAHQPARRGNPDPGSANRGGKIRRIENANSAFAADVLLQCGESACGTAGVYCALKSCPSEKRCRQRMLQDVFGSDIMEMRERVVGMRQHVATLSGTETKQHLASLLGLFGEAGAAAYTVRGEKCCKSHVAWAHGHSRHHVQAVCTGRGAGLDKRSLGDGGGRGKGREVKAPVVLLWMVDAVNSFGCQSPSKPNVWYMHGLTLGNLHSICRSDFAAKHQEHLVPGVGTGYFEKLWRQVFPTGGGGKDGRDIRLRPDNEVCGRFCIV